MNKVKAIRDFYGISLLTLETISGISRADLRAYENGETLPKSNMLLIETMVNIKSFNVLVGASKNRLKSNIFNKLDAKIQKELSNRRLKAKEYEFRLMDIVKT